MYIYSFISQSTINFISAFVTAVFILLCILTNAHGEFFENNKYSTFQYSIKILDDVSGEIIESNSIDKFIYDKSIKPDSMRIDNEFRNYVQLTTEYIVNKSKNYSLLKHKKIGSINLFFIYRHKDYLDSKLFFLRKMLENSKSDIEIDINQNNLYKEMYVRDTYKKEEESINNILYNKKNISNSTIESPWLNIYIDSKNDFNLYAVFVYSYPQILLDQAVLCGMNWENANFSTAPIPYYDIAFQEKYHKYLNTMKIKKYSIHELEHINRESNFLPVYLLWYCGITKPWLQRRVKNNSRKFEIELKKYISLQYEKITLSMIDSVFENDFYHKKYNSIIDFSHIIDLEKYKFNKNY